MVVRHARASCTSQAGSQAPSPTVSRDISLSGSDLAEFLSAVVERRRAFRFKARGFSMSPFIKDGDVLTVAPLAADVRRGDVIAFRPKDTGGLVVHRAVALTRNGIVARGDNAIEPDGIVAADDTLGILARVDRDGRRMRCGLGPERHLIAALSKRGLLVPLIASARRTYHDASDLVSAITRARNNRDLR